MKPGGILRPEYLVIGGILIGGGALSVALTLGMRPPQPAPEGKSAAATTASPTPIPTSQPEAKQYIARASEQAAAGNYPAAEATLKEAIRLFPSDQNLTLTLEYYENQAKQHNQ